MTIENIQILLAGGRKLLREGLCLLLQKDPSLHVVGEAEEQKDAARLVKALNVQVVILHLNSALHVGPATIRFIREARPGVRVIALTHAPPAEYVKDLMEAGASACLTKESASAELVAAVHRVVANGVYLSPSVIESVVTRFVRPEARPSGRRPLAPRERQILRLIAAGHSTKEIAGALNVSGKTIETHRRRIMEKLQRYSVAELTKYAVMQGLATLEASA